MTNNSGIASASALLMFFVDAILPRLPWESTTWLLATMLSANGLLIVLTLLFMNDRQRKGFVGS